MSFEKSRKVSFILLLVSLALYLSAGITIRLFEGANAELFAYLATALLVAAVVCRLIWARCPHCGCYISHKYINEKKCPRCRKNLYS